VTWLPDKTIARLQSVATWPEFSSDRYTVLEEIGRGGMGTVYLARDEVLMREVAIKVSHAIASESLERRIRTEAQVLARLEHPGIVPVHDVGRLADGRLYYVMKRVRGETLRELHARGAVPDPLRVFERVCEAVAFAHAQGCIHRDLKPENVMVGAFGEVMVMDWGVARLWRPPSGGRISGAKSEPDLPATGGSEGAAGGSHGGKTAAGTVLGTPGYMAPEQAAGEPDSVDERADVYGLGAILFALVVAQDPPADAASAIARVQDPGVRVPRQLRAICARALAPDRRDRYASAAALSADIARYRAGQAVDAHPETFLERTRRVAWAYRTPIFLVLAYMVMRVIVAVTAGW
jgi:serine/threonine protein kinase